MRLSYCDTAKCIAIFCIVMGHTGFFMREFLYSFHVQMFFVCAGFVYTQKYLKLRDYLKTGLPKLIKRIYIPYILLVLIFNLQLKAENLPWLLWGSDQTVMHGKQFSFMWFLPTYFSAVIIWNILNINLKQHQRFLLPTIIAILCLLSSLTNNTSEISFDLCNHTFFLTGYSETLHQQNIHYIGFPLNINIACTAVAFMYIGTILHKLFDKTNIVNHKATSIIYFIILTTLGIAASIYNHSLTGHMEMYPYIIAMSNGAYGNYPLFILTGTAISASLLIFSIWIDNKRMAQIGRDTFGIYALHPAVRNIIAYCIGSYGYIMYHAIGGIIMFFVTILILPFVKKWFPFIIGEKEK